ncbi:MAG: hypothetical protein KJN64_15385 [Ignavibacteria bacterium]|nr:hypothetical protein [Ignavibacteria bacterium]MBT8383017.1 hypothetical protein [Ignavibacteria bacterium]MBT8391880.1 hypothetical protein [Ignavibacteria bacterium]NNJ52965.1 hypothetical protein [Ignavibacteriaceae bacterium]NNL21440.1 hypothetical protein [Ignavibacteriaceae bacterium]
MTTLPAPGTNEFPDSSLEKQVYNIVESLSEYIPLTNDKNRLGFNLYKFMKGEGDPPEVLLKSAKIMIKGITVDELAAKIDSELLKISGK